MRFLMAVAMFALLAGGTWQIFTRWILRNPSTVTDEFLRYVLIWASMIGSAYCFYKDVNKDGKEVEVLSIMDKDGGVCATNSDTFKRDFMKIAELMDGEEYTIEVISGQSKAGR